MEAKYGETEIKNLLNKVRIFNKDLGDYQMFAITGDFDYAVKLTNGKITISIEELHDDVNNSITPDQLSAIAKRFKNSSSGAEKIVHETISSIPNPEKKPDQGTGHNHPKETQTSHYNHYRTDEPKKSRTWLYITIVAIFLVGFFIWYNEEQSSNNDRYDYGADMPRENSEYDGSGSEEAAEAPKPKQKTENELRQELYAKESRNPLKYLSAKYSWRLNLINQAIFEGTFFSEATLASFKNITIKLTGYSKTDMKLGSASYVITEFVNPGDRTSFRLKTSDTWDPRITRFEMVLMSAELAEY